MIANSVLIVGPLMRQCADGLANRCKVLHLPEEPDSDAFMQRHAGEIEALVLARAVDQAFLERFPRLRLIANFGVGYDNLPIPYCANCGIVVVHTPHVLTDDVADTAIALMLMAVRRFPEAERYLRAGRWVTEGMFPLSGTLSGRRVGILGLGRIGRAVAKRVEGFGLPVAYYDIAAHPDVSYEPMASALDLAGAVDVLIGTLPGSPLTLRLVNAEVLSALGKDGVFVNVGRGTTVDQPALIEALFHGTIAAAGLDVYESEPGIPQALLELPNIVLLPHVASGSHSSRQAMSDLVIENVVAFFSTGRALTPVPETPNPV